MDIVRVIKDSNNALVGAVIQDQSECYPITAEGLHNPTVFDGLEESGWKLNKLPYGFRRDGVSINDLPATTWEAEHFSESAIQDAHDIGALVYTEADLMAKLDGDSVEEFEFRQSTNRINTRAEFLSYLQSTEGKELSAECDYLPLNSFVNPAALFTIEEYFDPENSKYRTLIENRRNLSFTNLCKLVTVFKSLGLPDDYSTGELVDMYFAWGICGMRFPALSKVAKRTSFRVGSSLEEQSDPNYSPYIEMYVQSYVQSNGAVYRDQRVQSSQWKPVDDEKEIAKKTKLLASYGDNYIMPERLRGSISEVIQEIAGRDFIIQYDDAKVKIEFHGERGRTSRTIDALHVKKIGSFGNMPNGCLCLAKEDVFEEIFLESISEDILKRSFRGSNASSYTAVSTLGASPLGIIRYIFNKPGFVDNILADIKEANTGSLVEVGAGDIIDAMEQYVDGELPASSSLYTLIEDTWNEMVSGTLNIDHVMNGQFFDASRNGESEFKSYIKVAHKFLGLSYTDIGAIVQGITPETKFIEFSGNNMHMRIDLPSVSKQDEGYMLDVDDYRQEQAGTASAFGYVISAWRELGGKVSKRRHVGLELDLIDVSGVKAKNIQPVRDYLTKLLTDIIENEVPYSNQAQLKNSLPLLIANQYFSILYNNVIKLPKVLGGKEIVAGPGVQELLQDCVERVCDTCLNLSDMTISTTGKTIFYCVNAIVTPDYVIPRGKFKIREVSMVPMWFNTVGYDKQREDWYIKGLIPSIAFKGYRNLYQHAHLPRGGLVVNGMYYNEYNVRIDPYSLENYFQFGLQYLKEFPKDKELTSPPTPYESKFEALCDEPLPLQERVSEPVGSPQRWFIGDSIMIGQEDIIAREPSIKNMFMVEQKALCRTDGIKPFNGFQAEDFVFIQSLEDVVKLLDFDTSAIAATGVSGEDAVVYGDKYINYKSVEELCNSGKFQINHVSGRKYLLRDIKGIIYEVIV